MFEQQRPYLPQVYGRPPPRQSKMVLGVVALYALWSLGYWFWAPELTTHWKWLGSGMLAMSSVLLLIHRRWSWLLSVSTLFLFLILNLYFVPINFEEQPRVGALVMAVFFVLSFVFYYFRYPQLDRRSGKIIASPRRSANALIVIDGYDAPVLVLNMSLSGAFIQFDEGLSLPRIGEKMRWNVNESMKIEMRVVRVSGQTCGVMFDVPTRRTRKMIRSMVRRLR